jgi:enolase-phosphatase E1
VRESRDQSYSLVSGSDRMGAELQRERSRRRLSTSLSGCFLLPRAKRELLASSPIVPSPLTERVTTILLDIEGTTTPIDFVYEILFPYARSHVRAYLEEHRSSDSLKRDIARLLEENAEDMRAGLNPPLIEGSSNETLTNYIHWLMDRDRKTTALKSIQGKIWDEGYSRGELHSQVFEDVPRAFARWKQNGKSICIYSSGSVLAQKLLFANTEAGDLTPHISAFFDTNVGAKREIESYARIASDLKTKPYKIAFISDVPAELDAASAAGFETLLCVRPGNSGQSTGSHPVIHSFDQIP